MNEEQLIIYNEILSKYNFNENQKKQIRFGLEDKLDVSIYAKPECNTQQMFEIRENLENELD